MNKMNITIPLPEIEVGPPIRHEGLSVFPLFTRHDGAVDYRLAHEAIADGSVRVEEVDESGSVPDLLVENLGDVRILFLEGEELVGAKQNRIVNTTILVAAKSEIKIPVSCVEQGRWDYKSRRFRSSGSHSPSKLRYAMKRSVSASVKGGTGYRSNQREVWAGVMHCLKAQGVASSTQAMSDAFEARQSAASKYRESLPYVAGATGIAVAIGEQVVGCDVFDNPETCEKTWERLLSGCILEAMVSKATGAHAEVAQVEKLLATAADLAWERFDSIGEGVDYRTESSGGDHASALVFEDSVVHGSVVATA